MDTISINSENSKTSKSHTLVLKITDKLDLRISEKSIALLENLSNSAGSYSDETFLQD